jgi:hypothetical protein
MTRRQGDAFARELHAVALVHDSAEFAHDRAVDPDVPGDDKVLGLAPGRDPSMGEVFLKAHGRLSFAKAVTLGLCVN